MSGIGKGVSAAMKAKKAGQGAKSAFQLDGIRLLLLIASGPAIGVFLFIMATLLLVIIIVAMLGGLSNSGSFGGSPEVTESYLGGSGDLTSAIVGGTGKGILKESAIPDPALVPYLRRAAKECELLSPAILAAQIRYESNWDSTKVGSNGEVGIAQLPPDVFKKYSKDEDDEDDDDEDDDDEEPSATNPEDSIRAQARYLCALSDEINPLVDAGTIKGDRLTLTLWAYDVGIDEVKKANGMPNLKSDTYPYKVRQLFQNYLAGPGVDPKDDEIGEADEDDDANDDASGDEAPANGLAKGTFEKMFPNRQSFYTYEGLTAAMQKFPAFAGTGSADVRAREIAAFLGNVSHESGGLVYTEEINQANWGNYCDPSASFGCPAGQEAYHGRGPIQLSWNTNYQAAGEVLGVDLLNDPDKVKNDAAVAWGTALWFWMTQNGAGTMTAHSAIVDGAGFGETVRSINGSLECDGRKPDVVEARADHYKKFAAMLGVEPGTKITC